MTFQYYFKFDLDKKIVISTLQITFKSSFLRLRRQDWKKYQYLNTSVFFIYFWFLFKSNLKCWSIVLLCIALNLADPLLANANISVTRVAWFLPLLLQASPHYSFQLLIREKPLTSYLGLSIQLVLVKGQLISRFLYTCCVSKSPYILIFLIFISG